MKHSYFFMIILVTLPWALFAQAPPAPTKVLALASFYYVPDIRLSWQGDNSLGASSYRLYRSDGDTTHFQLVAETYYGSYADFQILAGVTYYYYVSAVVVRDASHIESGPSAIASATASAQGGGGGGGGSKRHNHGTIAGRGVDSLTGRAIAAVQIGFYRFSSAGLPVQKILTDGSGHFRATLDTGTYIVRATPPLTAGNTSVSYQGKWYGNAMGASHADRIHVDDTSRIVADFELARKTVPASAFVRGRVRDAFGAPIAGATVALLLSLQEMSAQTLSGDELPGTGKESLDIEGIGHSEGVAWKGLTDAAGNYEATVTSGRTYIALAFKQGFNPQFFEHQPGPLTANLLRIGGDTGGIDFALESVAPSEQFTIIGIVKDSIGVHIPSRIVLIPLRHPASALPVFFGFTDSLGSYTLPHVRAGRYFVLAIPFGKYAPAYYRQGSYGISLWKYADTVSVSGNVSGVDIGVTQMNAGGLAHLSGRVQSAGLPVMGAIVSAAADDGSLLDYSVTDADGGYSFDGLPSGRILISGDLGGFQTSQNFITVNAGVLDLSGVDIVLAAASVTSVSTGGEVPRTFALDQNYPNPFNPATQIAYTIPAAGAVSLKIYNVIGQEVATLVDGPGTPGKYVVFWNGRDEKVVQAPSGVYFYRLQAGSFTAVRKLMLLK